MLRLALLRSTPRLSSLSDWWSRAWLSCSQTPAIRQIKGFQGWHSPSVPRSHPSVFQTRVYFLAFFTTAQLLWKGSCRREISTFLPSATWMKMDVTQPHRGKSGTGNRKLRVHFTLVPSFRLWVASSLRQNFPFYIFFDFQSKWNGSGVKWRK